MYKIYTWYNNEIIPSLHILRAAKTKSKTIVCLKVNILVILSESVYIKKQSLISLNKKTIFLASKYEIDMM